MSAKISFLLFGLTTLLLFSCGRYKAYEDAEIVSRDVTKGSSFVTDLDSVIVINLKSKEDEQMRGTLTVAWKNEEKRAEVDFTTDTTCNGVLSLTMNDKKGDEVFYRETPFLNEEISYRDSSAFGKKRMWLLTFYIQDFEGKAEYRIRFKPDEEEE